jgi:hypothetical protein
MERRNFLRGMVVGAAGAACTALVKVASDAEVMALARQGEVVVGPPAVGLPEAYPGLDILSGPIYVERDGQFVPIGYATQVTIEARVDEMIEWTGDVKLVPGLWHGGLKFSGPWRR